MPLYITAAGDASRDVCEGGVKRREAFVKKYGLTYDEPIDLRDVLEEYGANDVCFLLGVVMHPGQHAARVALRQYAVWLATEAMDHLTEEAWSGKLDSIIRAVFKLGQGKAFDAMIEDAHCWALVEHDTSVLPETRALWQVLVSLTLPDRPLHDVVTKADAALQEYAVIIGQAESMAAARGKALGKWLG